MFKNGKMIDVANREYYNALSTNIKFLGHDTRVISISSVSPNEGKSIVSLNLAAALAHNDTKVLYIDADTRNSTFASRMRINEKIGGLTNYLAENYAIEEVIHKTDIQGLHIIHSGKYAVNPASLLQSKRFSQLIATLREHYQYIIIDTPPIGIVIDAAIITDSCDGSILVVEAGRIKKKSIKQAIYQLKQTKKPFLGIILNKVNVSRQHYGSYGNYGDYGQTEKKG